MNGKLAKMLRKMAKASSKENRLVKHPSGQVSNEGWRKIYLQLKKHWRD